MSAEYWSELVYLNRFLVQHPGGTHYRSEILEKQKPWNFGFQFLIGYQLPFEIAASDDFLVAISNDN